MFVFKIAAIYEYKLGSVLHTLPKAHIDLLHVNLNCLSLSLLSE